MKDARRHLRVSGRVGAWRLTERRHGTGWWDGKFTWAGRNLPPLVESGADMRIYEALLSPLFHGLSPRDACEKQKAPQMDLSALYYGGFLHL